MGHSRRNRNSSKKDAQKREAHISDEKNNIDKAGTKSADADSSKTSKDDGGIRVEPAKGDKPVWATFPGPRNVTVPLRVAMTREAYAQISEHAAASLEAEICGVLVGLSCEDDDGPFLDVRAAVRGDAARTGSTHVTFTHETWDVIHRAMAKDYPKYDIAGWYHSHPGFGVEFSEMDVFIQKNFFKASAHVAFVVDPLGGKTAMCLDTPSGIQYIDRFWVDGREHQCQVPTRKGEGKSEGASTGGAMGGDVQAALEKVEKRLSQALEMIDEQRAWIYRTVLTFGMLICVAVVAWIGVNIFRTIYPAPPATSPLEDYNLIDAPAIVDGKAVVLGLKVVKLKSVPPEYNEGFVKMDEQRRAQEQLFKAQVAMVQAEAARHMSRHFADAQPATSPATSPTTAPTTNPAPASPTTGPAILTAPAPATLPAAPTSSPATTSPAPASSTNPTKP